MSDPTSDSSARRWPRVITILIVIVISTAIGFTVMSCLRQPTGTTPAAGPTATRTGDGAPGANIVIFFTRSGAVYRTGTFLWTATDPVPYEKMMYADATAYEGTGTAVLVQLHSRQNAGAVQVKGAFGCDHTGCYRTLYKILQPYTLCYPGDNSAPCVEVPIRDGETIAVALYDPYYHTRGPALANPQSLVNLYQVVRHAPLRPANAA